MRSTSSSRAAGPTVKAARLTPSIVVHGGAGARNEEPDAARAGAARAVEAGLAVLGAGGRALDAVEAAVRVLEDDPVFNAGTGAALTRAGTVETDACIMDGARHVGAVAAVPGLGRAIWLARRVLEDGEHVLLVGPAAWELARAHGLEPGDPDALIVPRARRQLEAERARRAAGGGHHPEGGGTVGACAIDRAGTVAAATSTGGTTFKRPGRVGDSPIPGAGTWADDRGGAASATGHGESVLRLGTTRGLVDLLRAGMPAADAARAAIAELGTLPAGRGGVICVDLQGRLGLAHNTTAMTWGRGTLGSSPETGLSV